MSSKMYDSKEVQCAICTENILFKDLILHVKLKHDFHTCTNCIYKCDTCDRSYANFNSFRCHIKSEKSAAKVRIEHSITCDKSKLNNLKYLKSVAHNINAINNINVHTPSDDTLFKQRVHVEASDDVFQNFLKFIGVFLSDPSITRNHLIQIITTMESMMLKNCSIIFNAFFSQTDSSTKAQFDNFLMLLKNNFQCMNSECKLLNYLKSMGVYVEADKISLGYYNEKNPSGHLIAREACLYYVPLSQTLKQFFTCSRVFVSVYDYYKKLRLCKDGIVRNVVQSKYWDSVTNGTDDIIFPLLLYQDDVELGNGMGSHAVVHKITGMYSSIACLPPAFQSKLDNIFLVQVSHSTDSKCFDQTMFYDRVIKDVQALRKNGIEIVCNNDKITIYFQLVTLVGDNLGLNNIEGFVESFNAGYYCRICKMHKSECVKSCKEKKELLRNVENYEEDLTKPSNETGIKNKCLWNEVDGFHCAENYSVDIMHDLFEGICKYELSDILCHFIYKKKYFTLDDLNFRLKTFRFPRHTNEPPLINATKLKNNTLKMSASEVKTFMMYLGLIIGDRVPEDDEYWKLYCYLREIVSICLQSVVTQECTDLLEYLIEEHHKLYIKLFGDLKPKHHFLTHYVTILRLFGPLRQYWCMRFESFHRRLKKITSVISNRQNTCLSIAVRNQLCVAGTILSDNYFEIKTTFKESTKKIPTDFEAYITPHPRFYNNLEKISINEYVYKPGITFITDLDECGDLEFGEIMYLLKKKKTGNEEDEFFILFRKITSLYFDTHYQAWAVEKINSFFLQPLVSVSPSDEAIITKTYTGLFISVD